MTSAVAALSEAGIPVTARGVASSFHVITGHQKGDEPLQIPFDALAKAGGTLVFLMGMGALPRLSEGLLSAGMDPETPAAIVENGARPEQRKLLSTLARLPEEAAAMGLHSPAVIAVGAVCGLSGRYGWREKLPLHGQKIIAGRSGSAEGKLLRLLERMGASVYDLPLIRTDPLPGPLPPELLDSRWLTFSSKVGVRCFFARLLESGLDTRALSGVKIAAVGRATAAALREKGILPDLIPEQFDGEHLGKALIERTEPFDLITLCEPESPSGTLREMLYRRRADGREACRSTGRRRCRCGSRSGWSGCCGKGCRPPFPAARWPGRWRRRCRGWTFPASLPSVSAGRPGRPPGRRVSGRSWRRRQRLKDWRGRSGRLWLQRGPKWQIG